MRFLKRNWVSFGRWARSGPPVSWPHMFCVRLTCSGPPYLHGPLPLHGTTKNFGLLNSPGLAKSVLICLSAFNTSWPPSLPGPPLFGATFSGLYTAGPMSGCMVGPMVGPTAVTHERSLWASTLSCHFLCLSHYFAIPD